MPAAHQLLGRVFDRLTVVEGVRDEKNRPLWRCVCSCAPGREMMVAAHALMSGNTRSCGCRRRAKREAREKRWIGTRRGDLTVLACAASAPLIGHWWHCRCVCGVELCLQGRSLKGGRKSCGCAYERYYKAYREKNPRGVPRPKRPRFRRNDTSFIQRVFSFYRYNAKAREHVWDLSESSFAQLISMFCYYCGSPPANKVPKYPEDQYVYQGIDRLANDRGYVDGNVVPCCGECNRAKGTRDHDTYVAWLRRSAHFLFVQRVDGRSS